MTLPLTSIADAIGGFGIFLFSLRFLTGALDRSLARSLKPILGRLLRSPLRAIALGILATSLVQASSITVISAMGLLQNAFITLEQGFFVMLGATLGTTVKGWFFAQDLHALGPLLIGLPGIALVVVRHPVRRAALAVLVSVGFTFLGLEMLASGLAPLAKAPALAAMLQAHDATTLGSQVLAAAVGCLLTVAVQSSSTVLFLTLDLAGRGLIGYPTGAALILGANVGTTLTPILASFEFGRQVKQLAVGHLLVKATGVLLTLLFFPAFLGLVSGVVRPLHPTIGVELAAVHTGFNLINVVWWGLLAPFMVAFLEWLLPDDRQQGTALPGVVRRLLAGSPPLALEEAERQLVQLKTLTKNLMDECIARLQDCVRANAFKRDPIPLPAGHAQLEDGIRELLLNLASRSAGTPKLDVVKQDLRFADVCAGLFDRAIAFKHHLEAGCYVDRCDFPPELRDVVRAYQELADRLWLAVFFPGERNGEAHELEALQDTMDSVFVRHLASHPDDTEFNGWFHEAVQHLNALVEQLLRLRNLGVSWERTVPAAEGGSLLIQPGG